MVVTTITPPISTFEHQQYSAILGMSFAHIAASIAERLADLLYTNIWVLDERQVVLASKVSLDLDHNFTLNDFTAQAHGLRIPFNLDENAGTVIIGTPTNGEVISPRLTRALMHMVINQTLSLERSAQPGDQKNLFIFQLLQGAADDATIMQQAKRLGLDLAMPRGAANRRQRIYPRGICARPECHGQNA
jgi:sugar diacid utilization regulator